MLVEFEVAASDQQSLVINDFRAAQGKRFVEQQKLLLYRLR